MIYGLYHSAAGMLTSEYRQNITANNLANAETAGFKRDLATFAERIRADEAGRRFGPSDAGLAGLSGGMWLGQTYTDFSDGQLLRTSVDTDVALEGPGFFMVRKDGEVYLTRDGRMTLDTDGRLISVTDGAAVLGVGDIPLRANPRGGELRIDQTGRIFQDEAPIGQLAVADVRDPDALHKAGAGRWTFDGDDLGPAFARVRQGFVEQSGVQPLKELVQMMESSRAFQINAQMVSLQSESAGRMLSVLS